MAFREFLNNFHLGAASGWDLFILLIFLAAVLIYGLFLGRNRMIILLLASYFSLAIVQVFPWQRLSSLKFLNTGENPSASLKILVFLAIILLFYFLIPRSVLSSSLRVKRRGKASWFQLFILSIVQIGLLLMVILAFLPPETVSGFGPAVKKVFVGPEAQFVWITIPVLAMVLMKRKKKKNED
jgi:hypothetical protein